MRFKSYFLIDEEVYKKCKWFFDYWNDTLDAESISDFSQKLQLNAKQMFVNMKVSTTYP